MANSNKSLILKRGSVGKLCAPVYSLALYSSVVCYFAVCTFAYAQTSPDPWDQGASPGPGQPAQATPSPYDGWPPCGIHHATDGYLGACYGQCPGGKVCVNNAGSCQCVPPSCTNIGPGGCNGTCPPGKYCGEKENGCGCKVPGRGEENGNCKYDTQEGECIGNCPNGDCLIDRRDPAAISCTCQDSCATKRVKKRSGESQGQVQIVCTGERFGGYPGACKTPGQVCILQGEACKCVNPPQP